MQLSIQNTSKMPKTCFKNRQKRWVSSEIWIKNSKSRRYITFESCAFLNAGPNRSKARPIFVCLFTNISWFVNFRFLFAWEITFWIISQNFSFACKTLTSKDVLTLILDIMQVLQRTYSEGHVGQTKGSKEKTTCRSRPPLPRRSCSFQAAKDWH